MADVKKDSDEKRDGKSDAGPMVGGAFAGGAVGGIAGGAMAGAAAGGLGGPAGAAIGAAVGAVAGAIGGKAIAGRIDPETEDKHWRTNYASQPYVKSGATYDDYGPAYKLGYERYPDHHGRSFEEAEPELERDWDSRKINSRLTWSEAKHATRDAFNRTRDSVATATAADTTMGSDTRNTVGDANHDVVRDLNKLLRGEYAATETYHQALEKIRDEYGHDARFQQLAQIQRDHQQATAELRKLIQEMGGDPSGDSGPWGTWSNTVMGAARILGDKAALSALLAGEKSGLDDYQDVVKADGTPDEVRHAFRAFLLRNQEHVEQLEQMIAAS